MNKHAALRLKTGEFILYGSYTDTIKCCQTDGSHGRSYLRNPEWRDQNHALHPDGITEKGYTEWVPLPCAQTADRASQLASATPFKGPASGRYRHNKGAAEQLPKKQGDDDDDYTA